MDAPSAVTPDASKGQPRRLDISRQEAHYLYRLVVADNVNRGVHASPCGADLEWALEHLRR